MSTSTFISHTWLGHLAPAAPMEPNPPRFGARATNLGKLTVSHSYRKRTCRGISSLELLSIVTVLAVMAVMAISFIHELSVEPAAIDHCVARQKQIELQTHLWYHVQGQWPASDLSDIGSAPNYFPQGLPCCPVNNEPYEFDPLTHHCRDYQH